MSTHKGSSGQRGIKIGCPGRSVTSNLRCVMSQKKKTKISFTSKRKPVNKPAVVILPISFISFTYHGGGRAGRGAEIEQVKVHLRTRREYMYSHVK